MPLSDEILKKIEKYAIHMDWDVAFDGKSKGNMHLYRTNKLAQYFNSIEGGDRSIVIAGAWLHDVGLIEGNKGHCFKGVKIAREFLLELGIDQGITKRITHCIEAHDGEIKAETIEAKIVHDADTVDKMGPLGMIRHAWKMTNVDYHEFTVDELIEMLPKHMADRRDHLYLDSARKITGRYVINISDFFNDREMASKVLQVVIDFAKRGIPSDDVVAHLTKEGWIPQAFSNALAEQLNLSFLK